MIYSVYLICHSILAHKPRHTPVFLRHVEIACVHPGIIIVTQVRPVARTNEFHFDVQISYIRAIDGNPRHKFNSLCPWRRFQNQQKLRIYRSTILHLHSMNFMCVHKTMIPDICIYIYVF